MIDGTCVRWKATDWCVCFEESPLKKFEGGRQSSMDQSDCRVRSTSVVRTGGAIGSRNCLVSSESIPRSPND